MKTIDTFRIFNFDLGKLLADPSLEGTNAWSIRPTQKSGKVVNFDTLTPEELTRKQNAERAFRAELLADLVENPEIMQLMEDEDRPITDLIGPPEWL